MRQPSFNEIMDYSAENRVIYKDLLELMKKSKDSGDYKVVPFVGAGMSAFAYPMWKGALTELAKELGETHDSIKKLFTENSNLEDVADILWNNAKKIKYQTETGRIIKGTPIIGHILRYKIFIEADIKKVNMQQQAIYELACLFPNNLIITTNFDKALENAFSSNGKSISCGFPSSNHEMLSKLASENNQSYLFKMHGDIYGNTADIVFSTTTYDKKYKNSSKLKSILADIFAKKTMLFLGASLNQDRYLALLKESRNQKNNNKHSHFAILECDFEPDKAKIRREELMDYGIKAILYPKGDYDAVHIILEQLFEDINPIDFENFEPKFRNKLNLSKRFNSRNRITEFVGREKELERLNEFINGKNSLSNNENISWWAVCGPGGMGKSRIARELSTNLLHGWEVCSFFDNRRLSYDNIQQKVNNCGSKVLVIVDYAQSISSEFANWLRSIDKSGSDKEYRLLFLQREGYQYASYESDGERRTKLAEKKPYWLNNLENSWNNIESLAYQKKSLDLKPLNDEAITKIILSYATFLPEYGSKKKKLLTEKDAEALLEALKKLGEDFLRPLFAMFFADAHLSGTEPEPLGWDEQRILEHFSNREVMRLQNALKTLYEKKGKGIFSEDREALDLIISLATIQGDLQIDPTNPEIEIFDCFKNELYPNRDLRSLYKGMSDEGLLDFDDATDHFFFPAIKPDLLGEWTVFKFFSKKNKAAQKKLVKALKQNPDKETVKEFFVRFGGHYLSGHFIEEIGEAWLMELKEFFPARIGLMIGLETYAMNKKDFSVFNTVKFLSEGFDDFYTVINYSIYLAIQLSEQGSIGQEAERRLLELIKSSNYGEKIALTYANGLVNLSYIKESAEEIKETIQKIEALLADDRFPKSEEIALAYAKALLNLTVSQEEAKEIKETVCKIVALLRDERFPKSEEIALEYAKGLFNLTFKQESAEEIKETVCKIEALLEEDRFPKSEEIALAYAKALLNLTVIQEEAKEIKETACKIEVLLRDERFPKSEEIALEYAKGLFNLTFKQESAEEIKETIQKIGALLADDRFHKSAQIALRFAQGLVNLSYVQESAKEIKYTVQMIKALLADDRFPKSEEIALSHAQALVNLTAKQKSPKERADKVQKIESLIEERFPKS